ncbi:MAG: NADH-quinone oxidoreductase subunit N [Opitutae bacterium]|nr:NADH-quinone oxidoreductase subunit N [Opitutae bacterium]
MEVMTNMDAFQVFAEDNMWRQIWPELSLVLGAVLVLLVDLFGPKQQKKSSLSGSLAVLIQAFLLVYHLLDYLLLNHTFERSSFSGMLCHGFQGDIARTFFLLASLCVSIMGNRYLFLNRSRVGEFHHLTMVATAGLMLLCQSNNFIVLFVALETVALAFYPLVAYNTNSEKSLEAGLKYLIFGALSSALLLLGIVFLYGVGSNPEAWGASATYDNSRDYLSFEYVGDLLFNNPDNLFLRGGVVLILSGLAFKIGAAPFQIWVADVYHGSPTPITAFLAVSSKAAGFFLLLTLVNGPFFGVSDFLLPLIGVVATFTILFGNLAACTQQNIKRMLGLSGVAHAGYLLVAVMASMHFAGDSDRAVWVVYFYLFIYLFASILIFAVMSLAHFENTDEDQQFEHYQGLLKKHPWIALSLLVGIASLAGIPPFGGFIAKLMLFNVAFEAKLHWSMVSMVLGVVISIYYYFGWIREICFQPKPKFDDEEKDQDLWLRLDQIGLIKFTIICFAVVSFVLGIWQGPFGDAF